MAIHFNEKLMLQTLEAIHEMHEYAEVLNDLSRIDAAAAGVRLFGDYQTAIDLDKEMEAKYKSIQRLSEVAKAMRTLPLQPQGQARQSEPVIDNLWLDYCGIICGTAVKIGIKEDIKDLIEFVDNY